MEMAIAADRIAIVDLLNRHQIVIDDGNPTAWADLFAPDGEYASPFGQAKGTAALVALSAQFKAYGFTKGKRHLIGPITVDIHEGQASARSYYWVAEIEQFPPVIVSTGTYQDELIKLDGAWKISRRSQTIDPNWLLRDKSVGTQGQEPQDQQ